MSGTARISTDRDLIWALHRPDWKVWFGAVDDTRDGGPDDPRLALVLVDADSVLYITPSGTGPSTGPGIRLLVPGTGPTYPAEMTLMTREARRDHA